jgi:hypothetical protein
MTSQVRTSFLVAHRGHLQEFVFGDEWQIVISCLFGDGWEIVLSRLLMIFVINDATVNGSVSGSRISSSLWCRLRCNLRLSLQWKTYSAHGCLPGPFEPKRALVIETVSTWWTSIPAKVTATHGHVP